ncbi:hypothetical protein ElyMa_003556500 [Elysia marginata]|uniref:DUF7869 domain-containing protein n=1 Tax=Elysia marginata TaxID=1093978 RepID=A0AAV4EK99_9GAST|nr:hypothetical protein ElyMa_003556500 [Elysia marginata]
MLSKPATDLCWVCQDDNTKIQRSTNMATEVKQHLIENQSNHLTAVTTERCLYNECVLQAKETINVEGALVMPTLGPHMPNSNKITMHYSFDFAEQVLIPSNPMQPGPIYFLTPRECWIFVVNCEAIPRQINFLVDEGVTSGKGSSSVISYLHFFFEHFGFGELHVELHCDNCAGQNKNQYLLQYLAWRTMAGLHTDVDLHFMLPGHTKFSPDWCFGLSKKKFRSVLLGRNGKRCEGQHPQRYK